ncbi:putative fungal-specific transcription factor [Hyaloscypha variabilis F]|uniref:Putative fungal-specific transcription factor n=1 Tax=Hyaloscypha variabilis (strain UAMH 11265 / GT02V1 / F) TaxID=1149755 RepID=A0A2J6SE83_HYAVF|nr:putative fungal-specific transcription factor [Hyaloscypha variabilis F]
METPSSGSTPEQAPQVCTSCKKRKRKCNKALPKCSSCSKRNLTCKYLSPEENRDDAPVTDHTWYSTLFSDDRADVHPSIDFPTMLFLDPSLLQHGQIEMPRTAPPVTPHILHLLGDTTEIRATTNKYFEHVHLWMPFISKKRFYDIYLQPGFQTQPDISNSSNAFSIPVLQAGVLVGLYELGHAVYPAAFLTVGACARYAYALGINVCGSLNTKRVLTLVEVEERRRVWWAIVIPDRFLSIGCPGRPFATTDPTIDDLLPSNDTLWDQGIVRSEDYFTLSSPMTGHMSKFALVCQAARLLGQVLQHVSGASPLQDDGLWMQLDRTLQSMLAASLNVDALVALYTPWLNSNNTSIIDTDRSRRARALIQEITETMSTNMIQRQCFAGRNPEDMAPWGLFFVYHVCGVHIRSRRESSVSDEVMKSLREAFQIIEPRWNAASVYRQLLEAQEVIHSF